MIWKIVKSAIGFKTMQLQLHLFFNIIYEIILWEEKVSWITRCPEWLGLPHAGYLQTIARTVAVKERIDWNYAIPTELQLYNGGKKRRNILGNTRENYLIQ